jgi:hypothetical protein
MKTERSRNMAAILEQAEADVRDEARLTLPAGEPADFAPPDVRTISPNPLAPRVANVIRGAIVESAKAMAKEAMDAAASYVADAHELEAHVQRFAEDIVNTATRMAGDIAAHHAKLRMASERIHAMMAEARENVQEEASDEPPRDEMIPDAS